MKQLLEIQASRNDQHAVCRQAVFVQNLDG
jgi:hypothetical protein